jgi:hypothetical protein
MDIPYRKNFIIYKKYNKKNIKFLNINKIAFVIITFQV